MCARISAISVAIPSDVASIPHCPPAPRLAFAAPASAGGSVAPSEQAVSRVNTMAVIPAVVRMMMQCEGESVLPFASLPGKAYDYHFLYHLF
jgi:hypothetical protein